VLPILSVKLLIYDQLLTVYSTHNQIPSAYRSIDAICITQPYFSTLPNWILLCSLKKMLLASILYSPLKRFHFKKWQRRRRRRKLQTKSLTKLCHQSKLFSSTSQRVGRSHRMQIPQLWNIGIEDHFSPNFMQKARKGIWCQQYHSVPSKICA